MSDITLYWAHGTRAYSTLWTLEELGLSYRSVMTDFRRGKPKPPGYDALNPHGQVPTLVDGDVVVSETPAISLYLADRYSAGTLAPRLDEADRGPFLKWMVYSTAVLEASRGTQGIPRSLFEPRWGVGWRPLEEVVEVIAAALSPGPWLLGERFTAADIMMGAQIGIGLVSGAMAPHPILNAYHERLGARPAADRAARLNWPPEYFNQPPPG
jgi:glutathione S-transferase